MMQKCFESDYICRLTADCPLICIDLIEEGYRKLLKANVDYVSNTLPPTFPDGLDFEIFKSECIDRSMLQAKSKFEKEHVTPIIRKNNNFKKINIFSKIDYSKYRWTLDEVSDHKFFIDFIRKLKIL